MKVRPRRRWLFSRCIILIFFIGILFFNSNAQLSGDISSVSFSKSESPYMIEGDIFVPFEKKIIIPSGVVFLFKALDNLKFTIEGSLIVTGKKEEPVIFTSSNDPQFMPDSVATVYDWNGIHISGSAQQVMLRYAEIKYARNPVETRIPTTKLEKVKFKNNMYSQLIIDGKEVDVSQEQFFDYPTVQQNISETYVTEEHITGTYVTDNKIMHSGSKGDAVNKATKIPVKPSQKIILNRWWQKKIVRLSLLGAGILSAGCGAATLISSHSHSKKHNELETKGENEAISHIERSKFYKKSDNEKDLSNSLTNASIVSFALSGIFALGFVLTYTF